MKNAAFRYLGVSFLVVSIFCFAALLYYSNNWPLIGNFVVLLLGLLILASSLMAILNKKDKFYLGITFLMFFGLILPISIIVNNININTIVVSIIISLMLILLGIDFFQRYRNAANQI